MHKLFGSRHINFWFARALSGPARACDCAQPGDMEVELFCNTAPIESAYGCTDSFGIGSKRRADFARPGIDHKCCEVRQLFLDEKQPYDIKTAP